MGVIAIYGHQRAIVAHNESARSNYGKENVLALGKDGIHFLKKGIETAPEQQPPPPGYRTLPRTPPHGGKLGGIAEETEEEANAGTEADTMSGEEVGRMASPPPFQQQDRPLVSPLSSPSANLGQRVMSSPSFKGYETKQNKQIAELRNDININLGQVTDLKLEMRTGFSSMGDSINKGLSSVETMIKKLTSTISNVENNQTQTRNEMTEIKQDILMNRTDLEQVRRDVRWIQEQRGPGQDQSLPPASNRGDDAIEKLADILSRQSTSSKATARLPHFCLPKLPFLPNGNLDCIKYHSWKQKCEEAFRECSVGDSLAVNLIQNEASLPKRFREQIAHCTTKSAIFSVLDSLSPPLATQFEKLKRQLVQLPSAHSYQEQLNNYNDILLILNSMIQFFPTNDVGLGELTAALSSFQSADLLAGLPDNLARFETMHENSGETYISLLETYCQKRRADVNQIMTSLNIYRPEDRSADINNITVKQMGGGSLPYLQSGQPNTSLL